MSGGRMRSEERCVSKRPAAPNAALQVQWAAIYNGPRKAPPVCTQF